MKKILLTIFSVVILISFLSILFNVYIFSHKEVIDYDSPIIFLVNERYSDDYFPEYVNINYIEYYVDDNGYVVYEWGYTTRDNREYVPNAPNNHVLGDEIDYDINYLVDKEWLKMKDGDYNHLTVHDEDLDHSIFTEHAEQIYYTENNYVIHYVYSADEISAMIEIQ